MARSPFSGTFTPNVRPTVVMAPDAKVLINGESELIGCPSCRKQFDINKFVTSVQVDLNVDSAPGSATISLSVPRHTVDDIFFDGEVILSPMMEIEVFAKGYFLVEGVPQYYPIFWGLITEVGVSQSGSDTTVSIQCADILKWWELCMINVNPAYLSPVGTGQQGWSIFGNVLFGRNPYDMIFTLANQSFGDIVVGTGSLVSLHKEADQPKVFKAAIGEMMLYWEKRFSRIRSNLLLYGVNGVAVRGASISEEVAAGKAKNKGNFVSSVIFGANGSDPQSVFDPTSPAVTAFRTQFMNAGDLNFYQAEFQSKLEIANLCKDAIGFEFYMDVTGDIVFKPPFYNLDVVANKPVSWIQDIDIISEDFSESEAEVITQIQCTGSPYGNIDYGMPEELTPHVTVTDYHLLRRYGWRTHSYDSTFMGSNVQMFYHGMDILDRMNAKRHRGTVSIPLRPELRLGFPVYIPHKDQIWYVTGISHNIEFGGRAQTTLTLTAKRGKFHAPKGIGTFQSKGQAKPPQGKLNPKSIRAQKFELKLGAAATFPPDVLQKDDAQGAAPYEPLLLRHPKTGRSLGYPNVVMVYTRPFKPDPATMAQTQGKKPNGPVSAVAKKQQAEYKANQKADAKKQSEGLNAIFDDDKIQLLREKLDRNKYSYGLTTAGVYVYAYDKGGWINQFALVPGSNISVLNSQGDPDAKVVQQNQSVLIRPVSDERGFELVGNYRYGRGVSLRDGSLVITNGKTNALATISLQTAVSGDLFATLAAASQGLTTIYTGEGNPAETLAQLNPTQDRDLQTAVTLQPDGSAVLIQGTPNFVDAAPLGSPEEQGTFPSVEAGQLSRALTLAELGRFNEKAPEENCVCLSGRQELAFLNTGYQVETLTASGADPSKLFGKLADLDITVTASSTARFTGVDPEHRSPLQPTKLSYKEVQGKIDTFLYNLYSALDAPHQAYERILRGQPLSEDVLPTTPGASPNSGIAPPFNGLRRQALGDPAAIAQDYQASGNRVDQVLDKFAKDTKKGEQLANLQAQIAQAKLDKKLLDIEVSSLGPSDSEAKRQQVLKALFETEQNIANLELRYQQAVSS